MDAAKIRRVHALARKKGFDDELYRERLKNWTGREHCTQLKRTEYETFIAGLEALPDRT